MKQGGLTKHEKKFSERYGLSAINDAFHISTYAPYVDSMTVDRNAYNIIQTELAQKYLSDLKCVFYSSKNIEDFETWLDTLLNEKDPEDVRLAKRLLIGYTVEKLIEDVFRRVKRNLNSRG